MFSSARHSQGSPSYRVIDNYYYYCTEIVLATAIKHSATLLRGAKQNSKCDIGYLMTAPGRVGVKKQSHKKLKYIYKYCFKVY
jgi:hypothetical protein